MNLYEIPGEPEVVPYWYEVNGAFEYSREAAEEGFRRSAREAERRFLWGDAYRPDAITEKDFDRWVKDDAR